MESFTRSGTNRITPFWNRIPAFFLYGLNPIPVIFTCGLGIGVYLISTWWAYLIVYAITIKYSMAALQHTLRGELKPPKLTADVLLNGYELPLMLFAILVLFFMFLGSIEGTFGGLGVLALYGLGVILFPAMIICLGMSEQLLFSINPINLINLVRAIGWPYLALYGLLFSLGGAQSTFESFFLSNAAGDGLLAIWLSINTLFSIISFHMMGYVAMQYHEALGEPEPEALKSEVAATQMAGSDLLDQFISEGKTTAATEELVTMIKSQPNNIELRRRLHNYALITQQPGVMKRNARRFMQLAVANDELPTATQIFSDCRGRGEICHPNEATCYHPMVKTLRSHRQFKDAVALAKGFHTRFPDSEQTPIVYFELAKIFAEDLQRDDLAMQLLRFILKGFESHPVVDEVQQYQRVIEQLSGRG
ncbi:MAG: hypothetical protein ABW185_16045 [Sedimenticola sp.]